MFVELSAKVPDVQFLEGTHNPALTSKNKARGVLEQDVTHLLWYWGSLTYVVLIVQLYTQVWVLLSP